MVNLLFTGRSPVVERVMIPPLQVLKSDQIKRLEQMRSIIEEKEKADLLLVGEAQQASWAPRERWSVECSKQRE